MTETYFLLKETQLNVLQRLKLFIGFKEKKFLFKALFFQISSTVLWFGILHPLNLFRTLKNLHKRALRFLYNDHTSSYNDFLSKSDRSTMLISRQRALCIEIFKTVNKLNPPFMQKIFKVRTSCYSLRSPNDLAHISVICIAGLSKIDTKRHVFIVARASIDCQNTFS